MYPNTEREDKLKRDKENPKPRTIRIKLKNIKDKERILKTSREYEEIINEKKNQVEQWAQDDKWKNTF